ncbi:MAG TPA: cation:proton antiporter [Acidimicrobiales bacterium]|nr:cation:proton antiporter [Acidimicrobiales bacterium]
MISVLAATTGNTPLAFIELGVVAIGLALLARLADRLGIPPVPLYLLAGLAVGDGGFVTFDVSEDFISRASDIGVLLLLLTLGLEYTGDELKAGLRSGAVTGIADAVLNFLPGFACGLLLGWEVVAAILLGGATWVSSSGVVSKLINDFDWMANRETPAVLNLLVIEDLAMAVYLPVVGALVAKQAFGPTALSVLGALCAVAVILALALRFGDHLSRALSGGSDEALLLSVFGLTLLVGGLAEQVHVSAAIGAFLVGLALSGPVQHRAGALVAPLRDLFAATFFLFFSFQLLPSDLVSVAWPALALTVVAVATKFLTARLATKRIGVGQRGQRRAGAALAARGEFSIVIASLGARLVDGGDLSSVSAAFVLVTAIVSPLLAKFVDRPSRSSARAGSER